MKNPAPPTSRTTEARRPSRRLWPAMTAIEIPKRFAHRDRRVRRESPCSSPGTRSHRRCRSPVNVRRIQRSSVPKYEKKSAREQIASSFREASSSARQSGRHSCQQKEERRAEMRHPTRRKQRQHVASYPRRMLHAREVIARVIERMRAMISRASSRSSDPAVRHARRRATMNIFGLFAVKVRADAAAMSTPGRIHALRAFGAMDADHQPAVQPWSRKRASAQITTKRQDPRLTRSMAIKLIGLVDVATRPARRHLPAKVGIQRSC